MMTEINTVMVSKDSRRTDHLPLPKIGLAYNPMAQERNTANNGMKLT